MFSLGYTSKNMELIEFELKETKFAKSFKRKVAKIYLDSYASYICKKENCLSKLLPPNILYIKMISITYVTLCSNPSAEYYPFLLNFITPSLLYPWFIIIIKENWIQGGGNRVSLHFAVTFLDCDWSQRRPNKFKIVCQNENEKILMPRIYFRANWRALDSVL